MILVDNVYESEQLTNFMISINSSTIGIGTFSTYSPLASVTSADKHNIAHNNQLGVTSDSGIQVNISAQAREKLALEQSEIGQKLAQQFQENSVEDKEEDKNETGTELLDEMIEQIQKQIKETQQALSKLNSDSSKKVQVKQKMLESQLISLNATLLGLFGKKLAALEESAP